MDNQYFVFYNADDHDNLHALTIKSSSVNNGDEKIEAIANCNRRSWNVTKRTVKLSMTFINNYPVTITNGTATLLQNTTKHSIRTEQTPTVLTNVKYKFSYNVDGVVKYFYVTINIKL